MIKTYDTNLFIDRIEDNPLIRFLGSEFKDGYHLRFYQSTKGKRVMIDTTDEDMPISLAITYLEQLGLSDEIPLMFPAGKVSHSSNRETVFREQQEKTDSSQNLN